MSVMDFRYVVLRWAIFAIVYLGFPGVMMTVNSLARLGVVGFAFRRPLFALAIAAVWFVACGQGVARIADGLAGTAVASVSASDLHAKLLAQNRAWSTETAWQDFVPRCAYDFASHGANADWCQHRALPYVEDRFDESAYRAATQQWEADTGLNGALLPSAVAAVVAERVRAESGTLPI
jgi:hypothetical protein